MQTEQKKYIYIIFPLSKCFKSQCSKSFWTQNMRSTLFKQLGQTGPCKGYCLLTHGVGIMDGMKWGNRRWGKRRGKERMNRGGGASMCWGKWGSWDTQMVSWWISFIGFWHFPSGPFLIAPPFRSNNGRKAPQQWLGSWLGQPKAFRALLDGQ